MTLDDVWQEDLSFEALVQNFLFIFKPFFKKRWVDAGFVLFRLASVHEKKKKFLDVRNIFNCFRKNPGLHRYFFTSFYDWYRKLVPPSQPIRGKSNTDQDLVTRVFPRFRQFG